MNYFYLLLITVVFFVSFGFFEGKLAQRYYKLHSMWPYPVLFALIAELFFVRFGFSKEFFIGIALLAVYLFFALSDILTRQVGNVMHVLIFVIGCFCLSKTSWLSMIIGFFILGLPMLVAGVLRKGSVGGADIKFLAVTGWMFGWERGLGVLILGLLFSVLGAGLTGLIKHKKIKSVPMIPYFCTAGLIIYGIF